MKKIHVYLLIIVITLSVLSGCGGSNSQDIDNEPIETFEVINIEDIDLSESSQSTININADVNAKFESIDFYVVSGNYSRNVMQEDEEVLEIFALESSNFLRIFSRDLEREVFAYNYATDEFTYLYYFDDELLSKTVINVGTGEVVKDDEGYAEMLSEDANALKVYFYELLNIANLTVEELK